MIFDEAESIANIFLMELKLSELFEIINNSAVARNNRLIITA